MTFQRSMHSSASRRTLTRIVAMVALSTLNPQLSTAFAQGTAFTYQGHLNDAGASANGTYDLTFSVWTNASGPAQVGGTFAYPGVSVTNGLFTVTLDFGSSVFPGADRWLEIGVRTNGSVGDFTLLSPRHQVTSAPYAIRASNFGGAVADAQLSGNIARLNTNQTFTGTNLFTSPGRVGIGTTSPGARLEVRTSDASGNAIRFGYSSSGGAGNLIAGLARVSIATDDLVERLCIRQAGNVGIGLTGPNWLLELAADSAAKPNGGSWANSSDARVKRNIQPLSGALDKLTRLRGVSFEWINPADHANQTGRQAGFIAQEVERVFPNWVQEVPGAEHDAKLTPDGRVKSLSLPFEFDALTVEALRELHAEKDAEIAELRERISELEQVVGSITTRGAQP